MEQSGELEDPLEPDVETSGDAADPPRQEIANTAQEAHRSVLAHERSLWLGLCDAEQQAALRQAIDGRRRFEIETLVHVARRALIARDRRLLNLAFEALSNAATPLLLSQAWGLDTDDRKSQAQEVLLQTFEAIRSGKSGFAESNFAGFARRRSISLYRMRKARIEGDRERVEPTETNDPLDEISDHLPNPEFLADLSASFGRLPPRQRAALVQYYRLGLTQEEIAAHHQVDVRTIRTWLKSARAEIGISGDNNDP